MFITPAFIARAVRIKHNPDADMNLATFTRFYPDGVNLTRGICLYHAHKLTWGIEARALIRPDIAREYADALAEAERNYAATLAETQCAHATNLMQAESMLLADRAHRRAMKPAKRGYHEAWALAWFNNVLPELIERSQTNVRPLQDH